jgi:23S rRNA (cytidine1920-2'-O)/16S rRNA (cytidine1409-2'-O)-methyltransferase
MTAKPARKRLDALLVERGFAETPKQAGAMILAGEVCVDGQRANKSGASVSQASEIQIAGRQQRYASRGGLKLEGALEDLAIDATGLTCLDVGSSTGGFTDCLLQHGATRVYALDVNSNQLAWSLRQDKRVVPIKRNARALKPSDIPVLVDLVVIDVSFISVSKVLAPVAAAAKSGATFLILVKPQFELSRDAIGPGGIVKDTALHEKAVHAVRSAAENTGLEYLHVLPSRLPGAEGNQEYFLHARKKLVE